MGVKITALQDVWGYHYKSWSSSRILFETMAATLNVVQTLHLLKHTNGRIQICHKAIDIIIQSDGLTKRLDDAQPHSGVARPSCQKNQARPNCHINLPVAWSLVAVMF